MERALTRAMTLRSRIRTAYAPTLSLPPRWHAKRGWVLALGLVALSLALCMSLGAAKARWPILVFSIATLICLTRGWVPALLAGVLSSALVWYFYRTPPSLTKFWLEVLRDVLGLTGAVLIAWAFFRFEGRKRTAEAPKVVPIDDPDMKKLFMEAGEQLDKRVMAPDDIDTGLTFWGLILISASFFISIGLTVADYYDVFGH